MLDLSFSGEAAVLIAQAAVGFPEDAGYESLQQHQEAFRRMQQQQQHLQQSEMGLESSKHIQ